MSLFNRAKSKLMSVAHHVNNRSFHDNGIASDTDRRKHERKAQKALELERIESEAAELYDFFSAKARACGKKYVFSYVMAAYNVEDYIEETINSILNQQGGHSHVQIIVVDDGSSDGTRDIVGKMIDRYGDFIEYHYQDNQGVSVARNNGLGRVNGLYVSFLDSDDKLSKNTQYELMKFARNHTDINLFALRTRFFDAKKGNHPLNYICKEDKVIDLNVEYDHYPLSATRSFIGYSLLENRRFNTELRYTEDSFFIHEILLDTKPVFGALSKPCYYYRRREDSSSASNNSSSNPCWYRETLEKGIQALFDIAKAQLGYCPKYIQYAGMYELYWRLQAGINTDAIGSAAAVEYSDTVLNLIQQIDDDVILSVRNFDLNMRIHAYSLKHGYETQEVLSSVLSTEDGLAIRLPEGSSCATMPIPNSDNWNQITYDFITLDSDGSELLLDGRLTHARFDCDLLSLRFFDGNKWYEAELQVHPHSRLECAFDGTELNRITSFHVRIPFSGSIVISAEASIGGGVAAKPFGYSYGKFARLNRAFSESAFSYLDERHYISLFDDLGTLQLNVVTGYYDDFSELEKRFRADLMQNKNSRKALPLRRAAIEHMSLNPDERIWIFTDRVTSAEDSGEVMFRYAIAHPIENVRPIFIIRDDVPDYDRMKTIGEVIAAGSEEHLVAVLCADKIISSSADEWVINPFERTHRYVKDLLHFEFVFLQHGVIKESLASWLYKANKNISLFVTSSPRERQSIVDGDYGYEPDQIILTGLPRWDNFVNSNAAAKREIYFMPTWRSYLSPHTHWNSDDADKTASLVEWFSDTDYYKVLNSVLEDKRLLNLLEKHDFVLKFAPHPRVGTAFSLFTASERVQLLKPESFEYAQAYKDMSMLITDYSSVAFNVAIMKKPIAYIQFDKEKFYEEHTGDKDYYDYERDGFGPVVKTKDELVDVIERMFTQGMQMDEDYKARVDGFFYQPQEGVSRASLVMDEILKHDSILHG